MARLWFGAFWTGRGCAEEERAKRGNSMLFRLKPAGKEYLWGGNTLVREFGKESGSGTLAESWELSCHEDGLSAIADGPYAGISLREYLEGHPQEQGTVPGRFPEFPVLVKWIDAAEKLSVQVHPDDGYAYAHEHQPGKTEMWYVAEAGPGAEIYLGFKRHVTKEEFEKALRDGTICGLLRRIPVKKGDTFFIEPGTVHAIGAGVLVAEIQQSSNVTYRLFDYGRTDKNGRKRELHIRQACEVASLDPVRTACDFAGHLGRCRYFTVDQKRLNGREELVTNGATFYAVLVLAGSLCAAGGGRTVTAGRGACLYVGAEPGRYELRGSCELLMIYVETEGRNETEGGDRTEAGNSV